MFNQLIESEPAGADFKNRRKYFLTSSVVVGILFVTAVVISIYAADIGLGNNGFELAELISPPDMAATEPEPVRPRPPASASPSRSELPSRQVNMPRLDESPTVVPTSVSTIQNTQQARPLGGFEIRPFDSTPAGEPSGNGRDNTGAASSEVGLSTGTQVVETVKDPPPPPLVKKDPPVVKRPVSIGVANGKALYLPKPSYSAAAIAMHADGKVDVQVTIDETGRVTSANAVSGHILLRAAAEQAARAAKFTPTLLSNVPVKVTGMIVYNFTR